MTARTRTLVAAIVVGLVGVFAFFALPALAHMGEEKFRIVRNVSRPRQGPRGKVELRASDGSHDVRLLRADGSDYVGSFEIKNVGPGPLTVNRVFVAGAEDDPRAAPGIGFVGDGNTRAPILPGASRRYDVTWKSDQARALQVDAAVVVDSDAADPDATVVDPPKLIGIHAQRRLGLARYALSVLIFVPLVVMLLAAVAKAVSARVVRGITAIAFAFETGLAGWVLASFDPLIGKRDGNEGLQFVEHAILSRASALEYVVGVDGWSIALLFLTTGLVFVAALSLDTARPGFARRLGALGALQSGAVLALTAQTMPLFTAGMILAGIGATLFVSAGGKTARTATLELALATLVAGLFLVIATLLLGKLAGSTYLADGTDAARTYGYADIARSKLVQHVEPLAGLPAYRALWLFTFLGLAPFLPVAPLHGWLRDVAPTRGSWVLVGILPAAAGYGLLRVGIAMQPEGARWAAESLPIVGAIWLAWSALLALAESDVRRSVASLALGHAGLLSFFAFALTPEGLDAAVALVVGGALAGPLALGAASTIADRVGDGRRGSFAGIARAAPVLGGALVLGALALGAPILPGAWSSLVGLIGSFGKNPVLTIVATLALSLAAVAAARIASSAFGVAPASWQESKVLEPHGGVPPDARGVELGWLVPLLIGVLALGFVPRAFLGGAEEPIRELWPRLDPPGPTQIT